MASLLSKSLALARTTLLVAAKRSGKPILDWTRPSKNHFIMRAKVGGNVAMGFSISWMGFEGRSKDAVLSKLGFVDLGQIDEANEAPFSIASLPTGWVIVFSNDFEFGAAGHIAALKDEILSCQVHEGIMFSAVHSAGRKGNWSAWHDGQIDLYNLNTSGAVPAVLAEIIARLHGEQDANGGRDSNVDFSFDIPVELAEQITGYRHDRWRFNWGKPEFTVIARRT